MTGSPPLALALLLALPGVPMAARTVTLGQDPVLVRLEVAQPTAVVFPEAVAAVPTGADPARLSLDYDGPYLFLQAREPDVQGRLFVVGASTGRLYGLRFAVAARADDRVTIVVPAATAAAATPHRTVQPLDLLKALRFGTPLPGVTAATLPPVQSPDARLQVQGQQALALGTALGVVLTLANVHPEPVALDLRVGLPRPAPLPEAVVDLAAWPLPPGTVLTAIAADDEWLGPHATTRLYWLLHRRP